MQDDQLRQTLQSCCLLLSNLIDPTLRKMQVEALNQPATIERLKALLNDCRGCADRATDYDDPAPTEPPRPSAN